MPRSDLWTSSFQKSCPGKISEKDDARPTERKSAQSHYISSEVLERVFARGEYPCEFVAKNGTPCRARAGLQVLETGSVELRNSLSTPLGLSAKAIEPIAQAHRVVASLKSEVAEGLGRQRPTSIVQIEEVPPAILVAHHNVGQHPPGERAQ